MASDGPDELARRLNWLFELVHVRVEASTGSDGDSRWRVWSPEEVADAIAARLGGTSQHYRVQLEQLRAGRGRASAQVLAAVAEHFGATSDYLIRPADRLADEQRVLIERTLRGWGARSYWQCRTITNLADDRNHHLGRTVAALGRVMRQDDSSAHFSESTTSDDRICHDPEDEIRPEAGRGPRERGLDVSTSGSLPAALAAGPRPLTHQQLRGFVAQLLDELDVRPPLTPEALCGALGAARGRRIKLVGSELNTTASVGHLIAMPRRDVIAFQSSATRAQQIQVIHHEVMHLACGHLDGEQALMCGALEESDSGGGLYANWQEWEAETGATILSELTQTRSRSRATARAHSAADQGLGAAFGLTNSDWR